MNLLTFSDLKDSELPSRINLCPDDPRFLQRTNRAFEWLFLCGSWMGTVRPVQLCVKVGCVITPPFVANIESVWACEEAVTIENNWYRMLPGFHPIQQRAGGQLWFEYTDQVPWMEPLCLPRILRSFPSQSTDRGRTITFLGYDTNRQWVRTKRAGLWQDGETVTLMNPFSDTVTEWTSVTQVIMDPHDGPVRVFQVDPVTQLLTPFGDYQYWETKPWYQRYRVHNRHMLDNHSCRTGKIVEANVKLCFIPIQQDTDVLPIQNRVAIEMAVMGVKALDDGDSAKADLLLYGDGRNQRIGAVPLLNQEIRTQTGDRFAAFVRVWGPCGFGSVMRGMV